ncbi:MAG: UDP-N-acetylmuramoyl-tripeptide--D-alanyl-D-alanine ligase [Calditrichaeota bacterium]|nr:UDP-N-acetylmuramoyl-tripeptide--D-alanyl-D-alanine ligase [Calditrichota bacterium]
MNLSIQEVQRATGGRLFHISKKALGKPVHAVVIDSRKVEPGDLFFALRGERHDAHTFLDAVFRVPDVTAVVDQKGFEKQGGRLSGRMIVVQDTLEALQNVSAFYRRKFTLPVLAVTGSNGKTTTKEMIAAVLGEGYRVVKNSGNLNNHIGVPLTLFEIDPGTEFAVVEMGANHFGEIARLCEIADPDWGLVTNVGNAHLEYFGSLHDVARAKGELFTYLSRKNGLGFINQDDPLVREIARVLPQKRSFGLTPDADVQGEFLSLDDRGQAVFRVNGETIHLRVAGIHQVSNALAAAAVGVHAGLSLRQIKQALEAFTGVGKRMELLELGDILVLNDTYNANLNSMEYGLKTLAHIRHQRGGRSFAVLADMLELGPKSEEQHGLVGEIAAEMGTDFLLTFGEEARAIHKAALEKGLVHAYHFEEKEDLENFLQAYLRGGDLVLVKGSRGMEMETIVRFLKDRYANHSPEK